MRDAATQDRWRNGRAKLLIFHEIAKWRWWRHAPQLMATAVVTDLPSFFEEMTRYRCKRKRRRWPGNPNGRSKCRDLRLFTFTRSQLTLRRRLCSWRRRLEVTQTAHSRCQKHRRRWEDRSKFRSVCLRDQAKPLKKHIFAARTPPL